MLERSKLQTLFILSIPVGIVYTYMWAGSRFHRHIVKKTIDLFGL